ncbi:unnamed protein product [Tenebrio molitor]|nr:unnamed protein product [Tenebrio molitor]
MVAAPYEHDQNMIKKNRNKYEYTPFAQLTLLTDHTTLELCLYRAAKIL